MTAFSRRRPVAGVVVLAVLAVVVGVVAASGDDPDRGGGSLPSTSVDDAHPSAVPAGDVAPVPLPDGAPPEVRAAAVDWPLANRDYRSSRAVPDSPITAATIDDLEIAWEYPLPGSSAFGNAATTPLVLGDTVYVQDLSSNVHAIDRATGEARWSVAWNEPNLGPNGVAVGYGHVYAIRGRHSVVALDLDDGAEVWSRDLTRTDTDGIDIQPIVHDGRVLVSTVPVSLSGGYTGGDRGILYALDAATGTVVWEFDTVDSDDLWGNPEVNSGGGAWYPPALDEDAGLVYWGVANPGPISGAPGFPAGASRPGPNLYTNSVVALDLTTGAPVWHRQAIEGDLFDRDLVLTQLVPITGGEVLVATGKLGRVFGHDPATGAVLWDVEVGIHRNDEVTEWEGELEVLPGALGGVETPIAAADGVTYVTVVNAPTTYEAEVPSVGLGTALGQHPSQVVAIDAATGDVVWDVEVDGDVLGGATVVGDLVLTSTFGGRLVALARDDGAEVWSEVVEGAINGWPAVAGDLLIVPVGLGDPPRLVAFRLPDGRS